MGNRVMPLALLLVGLTGAFGLSPIVRVATPCFPVTGKLAHIEVRESMRCSNVISMNGEEDGKGKEEEGWTLEKVAKLGIAGVLSIAVAETVFWVLSFPVSELVYFLATGEYINLFEQEGQLKFLAFTAGWGAVGGAIAQYRTVLTAAAMTPWMDRTVVQPYLSPFLERFKKE